MMDEIQFGQPTVYATAKAHKYDPFNVKFPVSHYIKSLH